MTRHELKSSEVKDHFSVLIPDGESDFATSVLRCLSQITGLKAHVLSNDPWAPICFSRYRAQLFCQTREEGDEGRLAAICQAAKQTNVNVILPVDQQTIRLLSVHGRTLSQSTAIAPLPDTEAFEIAANKWSLANFLKKSALACPPTILYQTGKSIDRSLSTIPFPVLIKPTTGSYGRGIKLFDDPSALLRFFEEQGCSEEFVVQSFIKGYDIDCSVLCQEGKILAYTIQKGFIGGYHRFSAPAGIDFLYDSETLDVVKQLVDSLKWSGIAHIDLRYDEQDKRIKVIEINPRFWGSLLGSLIAGVNFPYLTCLAGLGADLPKYEYHPKRFIAGRAAVRMLTQRFLRTTRTNVRFDDTSIGFILRDPFPHLLDVVGKLVKKVPRKIQKKAKTTLPSTVHFPRIS